ncbi:MAG: redox-sensitive transcriptional activator SoxR [Hyphomonadaceae bacterium]|nr:redox-sensitive transcriptional activator SoxR [Hyphomonadaceae bacterium]
MAKRGLSIGDLAVRTGLSVSAIRFYEARGLVHPDRNAGGQRRFERSDIRRLSFVMIAQRMGLTIEEIGAALSGLPEGRTPTKRDWEQLSQKMRAGLEDRIAMLTRLRNKLDGCIGCGCLSMEVCALYNPDDAAGENGPGPRFITTDESIKRAGTD